MSEPEADSAAHGHPPPRPALAATLWALSLLTLAIVRLRAGWPPYVDLHRRLAELGVPDWLRHLDSALIMLAAALAAALVARAAARIPARDALALRPPRRGWIRTVVLASAPVLLGGLALMLVRAVEPAAADLFSGVLRAPIVEEIYFRGLLVALPVALLAGRAFWPLTIAGGLVFGLVHIPWTLDALASGWPTILVTGGGGVWYAWLMREWRSVLVPILLHAVMNLGWILAGAGGAAGGGLTENILRVATIAIATALTIRLTRPPKLPNRQTAPPHSVSA